MSHTPPARAGSPRSSPPSSSKPPSLNLGHLSTHNARSTETSNFATAYQGPPTPDDRPESAVIDMGSEKAAVLNGTPNGVPVEETVEQQPSRAAVIGSVTFYLVTALIMVFANKWVLNSIAAPVFLLFLQLVIAVVLLHIASFFGYFTIPAVRLDICKGLWPVIGINCLGLMFNTFCLQYVDASFYQVARGLILPFTVLLSYILLGRKEGTGTLAGVGVVCIGFLLGISTDRLSLASPIGIFFGVFSSATTSVHAIIVKRTLPVVRGNAMDLAYYTNLLSGIVLAPVMFLVGEGPLIWELCGLGAVRGVDMVDGVPKEAVSLLSEKGFRTFWIGALVTGFFGFLICIAGIVSIKTTSPTSHMVSSAVRSVLQTFLGKWCFGDVITSGRASGIGFILVGSTLYTFYKDRESQKKAATTLPTSAPPPQTPSPDYAPEGISSSRQPSVSIHVRKPSVPTNGGSTDPEKAALMRAERIY